MSHQNILLIISNGFIFDLTLFLLYLFLSFTFKVKATWLKLTPYILSVAVYFYMMEQKFYDNNFLSTTLKCLPIFLLMAFIWSMGGIGSSPQFKYQRLIHIGLVFSVFGDAFLDYNHGELFPLGMAAFALAQITYITAFGWKPFKPILGLVLFVLAGGSEFFL